METKELINLGDELRGKLISFPIEILKLFKNMMGSAKYEIIGIEHKLSENGVSTCNNMIFFDLIITTNRPHIGADDIKNIIEEGDIKIPGGKASLHLISTNNIGNLKFTFNAHIDIIKGE